VNVAVGGGIGVGVGVLLGDGVGVTVGEGVGVGVSVAVAVGVRVGKRVGVCVGVEVNGADDDAVFGPSSSSSKDIPHDPVTHSTNKTNIASGKISFLNMSFSYLLLVLKIMNWSLSSQQHPIIPELDSIVDSGTTFCVCKCMKIVTWVTRIKRVGLSEPLVAEDGGHSRYPPHQGGQLERFFAAYLSK